MTTNPCKKYTKLCRMCLVSDEKVPYLSLNYIIAFNSQDSWPIFNFVEKYINLSAVHNDRLPQFICGDCITMLINFHFFYEKCHENEEILCEKLKETVQDTSIPNLMIEMVDLFASDEENDGTRKENTSCNPVLKGVVANKATPIKLMEYDKELIKIPKPANPVPPTEVVEPIIASPSVTDRSNDEINPEYSRAVDKNGTKYHVCKICNKGFKYKRLLKRHIDFHIGSQPYKCNFCSKAFAQKSQVQLHLLGVHKEPLESLTYPCRYCKSEFIVERELVKHYSDYHSKLKQNPGRVNLCDACGHEIREYNSDTKASESGNLFECEVCEKRYITSRMFGVHQKRSSDIINFKCDYCGKDMKTNNNLRSHIRIHAAEQKRSCHLCKKQFLRLAGLKVHLKSHEIPVNAKRARPSKTTLNYVEELFSSDDEGDVVNDGHGSTTESCREEVEEILIE